MVYASISPARPSPVFNTFWHFAAERQSIFFARLEDRPAPWTADPILRVHKFTNAYRASDRVSQYLIRNVIYRGSQEPREIFFRTMLFKLFNKIETWELLEAQLGEIKLPEFQFRDYERVLSKALKAGGKIYSAAYIMAPGRKQFEVERKHQAHLKLLQMMVSESVAERLAQCRSMRQAFELLRTYPLIGDFLGYQLVTDLNYSEFLGFSEMEFTVPGPGARDGIRKCFRDLGGLSEVDAIKLMADRQEVEFARLGIQFRSLGGRRLQLIDIQNLFCEVDKYARLKHPEVRGLSGRTRIKQKFRSNPQPIDYLYPPKWQLTDLKKRRRNKGLD